MDVENNKSEQASLSKVFDSLVEILGSLGFDEEVSRSYAALFQKHEIDSSIIKSNLLNHDLLKEIGIDKLGHRLKILALGKPQTGAPEEDYNQRPTEKLSLDAALNETETPKGQKRTAMEIDGEGVESGIESNNNNADLSSSKVEDEDDEADIFEKKKPSAARFEQFMDRCKYIPLRLNEDERHQLRLIEAGMNVSDYTGKVDIVSYSKKTKRSFEQLKEICAILSGLLVASDYSAGQRLIAERNFKDNEPFFQDLFELGRRYKICNPEKLRSEYGKLVYMLMDSALPEIEELLQFRCVKKVKTVYDFLEERNAADVLKDQYVFTATQAIVDDKKKQRYQIQQEIKDKERAVEYIANKYESSKITRGEIKLCLRSIGDNNSFLLGARDPIDRMLALLQDNFDPDHFEHEYSLAISYGRGGARLSHDHSRQYAYVHQSLMLWREVTNDMFRLWILAEDDLMDATNRYRLTNTGQGLNRVQNAPRIGNAMHRLLNDTKRRVHDWVGSSVVHLGDHNVPNALMFIDKYTQIPRIINPVLLTVQNVDELVKDDGIRRYIDDTFGGKEKLKMDIMCDFFRHAFDGSGADNFFDAGSCIDGRLTSAWNWCEKLSKKHYYPIFKLNGFSGFDGDWQK